MYINERKNRVLQKMPAATGEWCPHRNIETVRGVRSNDLNWSSAERRGNFEDSLDPIFVRVAGSDWYPAYGTTSIFGALKGRDSRVPVAGPPLSFQDQKNRA